MTKHSFFLFLVALFFSITSAAQLVNHWRGPDRDGHYHETNLLDQWPADGPQILWAFEELGSGYSSAVMVNDRILVTGLEREQGYFYVLTFDGKLERKIGYGPERSRDYPGSRVSPTVAGNMIYMASAYGVLSCIDFQTGQLIWSKDLFNDFDGSNIQWGYTENLVVDGDRIYCSPGGTRYNVVALNRHNGDLIWSSPGVGGLSAHCSPLLFDHGGRKILATHMAKHLVGFDAGNGQLLWSHPFVNTWDIHPNTPIYSDGGIFFFSGYGQGGIRFNLNHDGSRITKVWENSNFDVQFEGVILHNGHLYGSGQQNRFWFCLDWETGESTWRSRDLAKGSPIMADGKLFIYSDRGELALAKPSPESFQIISQTRVSHGSEQHWAHPVIHEGVLYIRRGNALVAYKVK